MKTKKNITLALALCALITATAPLTALADRDDHREWRRERHERYERHDRNFDGARWHRGRWYHGYHEGRLGWWWVVAPGLWYWYAHAAHADAAPPQVVVVQPPAVSPPPPAPVPAAPQYWYYCKLAKAYYPYVSTCPGGWQRVPATPVPSH